jgi:hypothetical protein
MKIICECGRHIRDNTDGLSYKAHFIPDESWSTLWDEIDAIIEGVRQSTQDKERACMNIRSMVSKFHRQAWQCTGCGALYLDDRTNRLCKFSYAEREGSYRKVFTR